MAHVRALIVRGEKVQKFLEAACSGNIKLFKKLAKQLDDGKGLAATVANVKDRNKRGALIFAATEDKIELCKYLVEELKINVNEKDVEGETPILHAARQGHTATVQYLIEQGADPAPIPSGPTALHHAAGNGLDDHFNENVVRMLADFHPRHIELVKFLLSKGVDVDLQSDGSTPLMWAAGLAQADAVKVLLEHHANLHVKTEGDNISPLPLAVAANSLPCVELLLKAGANVNVRTSEATPLLSDGEATPLLIAAHRGNAEIINYLLQAGADPNAADEDGNKPLHVAATRGSRAAVKALLPVTPRIQSVPEWTVDGVIEFMQAEYRRKQVIGFMQAEYRREQERTEAARKANKSRVPKKDLPKVTPEAKKKAADAKASGEEAFKRKDFATAVDAYTQAIDFDPTDGTLFSNRSLCLLRLGQAEHALSDAKACRELRPDWAKACYREGAALRLLQRFEEAAHAFYEGVQIDHENTELITAFREAVEAGRKFHGTNKKNSSSSSC